MLKRFFDSGNTDTINKMLDTGRDLERLGNNNAAVILYKKLLDANPECKACRARYAIALHHKEKQSDAASQGSEAEASSPR